MSKFIDLYNFIQKVDRDEVGKCDPISSGNMDLHIYSTRHQVNVERDTLSICNIVFDDDWANVYKVANGYCDYDHPICYSIEDDIIGIPVSARNYIEACLKS